MLSSKERRDLAALDRVLSADATLAALCALFPEPARPVAERPFTRPSGLPRGRVLALALAPLALVAGLVVALLAGSAANPLVAAASGLAVVVGVALLLTGLAWGGARHRGRPRPGSIRRHAPAP
ncbi:hypothetical protein FNH05_18350 [Amycolatopsis rhizosphaerae]|uniref:DUF3040 domain-containing protein n=1 Tax=Amycolatopsis rhizosphaerae TaxID=2053003 RepID=A0A558CH13_9PSEU|nr:hypothetical protein [Amycolatopsis rhizosphaerae]TVT48068.1 hypothetical protein FNH05_18350 [Amycolatopsis rhizosphaerae]